jgi:hypothetical protein
MKVKSVIVILVFTLAPLLCTQENPHKHLWVRAVGADLPAYVSTSARETITVGETFDVEFSTATAKDLLLDLLLPGQKIHATQTLSFQPAPSVAR